ncbi:MAG: TldD/PmbA family protein [Thermodesulfobacteriota bacterium]
MNLEDRLDSLSAAAAKSGAEDWEVYLIEKRSLAVAAKEGRIDQVRRTDELAAALRLIVRGRLGFAYTSIFTPEAVREAVARAAAGAGAVDPEPGLALPGPPEGPWPEVDVYDQGLRRVSQAEKMDRVLEMEAAAKDFDPRIERVRLAEYTESEHTVLLANSHGLRYRNPGTVFSGSITAKAVEAGEAEMGEESDFSRYYDRLDLKALGREAARRAVTALGGRLAPTGRGAVLLENRVAAEFLEVLSSSFLADHVQKGKSVLAGKTGQKVMSPLVDIVDDGLYPGGLATSPADAEGTPKRRTVLVGQGLLQGFLYDVTRAGREGRRSTGNAGRNLKSPPGVATTNFILCPGGRTFEELVRVLDRGLLVTEALGVHTADHISGDFSFGVAGFWIESGRIGRPVKGMALAGNLFKMMDQVLAVGSDLRLLGAIGAPSLLVDGLALAGL